MKSLIVDDIGTIQRLLTHMLKEFGSCEYAQNGLDALEKQKEAFKAGQPFDLICLDIMMPDIIFIVSHPDICYVRPLLKQGKL